MSVPDGTGAKVASPDPAEGEVVELDGVLIVLDARNVQHRLEEGRIVFLDEDSDEAFPAPVREGRWRVRVPRSATVVVGPVEVAGQAAAPIDDGFPRRDPATGELEVVVRLTRETLLVVRGLDTGLDLADVEVAESKAGGSDRHPGAVPDNGWVVRGARSPIDLVPDFGDWRMDCTRRLYVRAPGYAWDAVRVNDCFGGEFLIALEPAGALEVAVAGHDPALEVELRLRRRPGEEPWLSQRVGEMPSVRVDGLAAGAWTVSAEVGHAHRWPIELARAEVEIAAGAVTRLELALLAHDRPERVPLSGELVVPREWGDLGTLLRLEFDGQAPLGGDERWLRVQPVLASEGDTSLLYGWEVPGGVAPGRWNVEHAALGVGLQVEVGPAGRSDVRLELPPPGEVEVLLLDAGDGRPVVDASVSWMPERDWTEIGGELINARPAGAGRFRFRAPLGRSEVWCSPERHRFERRVIHVHSGRNELRLALQPACGFVVCALDGDTLRPWDFGFGLVAVRTDGEGYGWIDEQDSQGIETRFVVTCAGRYRLDLSAPPGFQPLGPQFVDVPPRGFARLDVSLERLR